MSLWGTLDNATGNQKPKWANTANVYGVSRTEAANTSGLGRSMTHSGWNEVRRGRGPVKSITLTGAGTGINANGFLTFTGGGNVGAHANASYVVSSNANSTLNTVVTVTLNSGGDYNAAPTVSFTAANTSLPTFSITMGMHVGRVFSETLVAARSISGDDTADNGIFPGT